MSNPCCSELSTSETHERGLLRTHLMVTYTAAGHPRPSRGFCEGRVLGTLKVMLIGFEYPGLDSTYVTSDLLISSSNIRTWDKISAP
jgi:hypothetical protein